MKQLSFLCLMLVLLFSNSVFSQSDNLSKKQVKFYFNSINEGYEEYSFSNNDRVLKSISKIGIPSIAYSWQTSEKKWQEIEFSAFLENNQGVSIAGSNATRSFNELLGYVSFRYERNRILLGSDKVDLTIGGSFQAAYLHNSFAPLVSSDFPFYYNGIHTKASVIPRALFKFERFALDFNIPFSVMQLNLNTFREENPLLSRAEQSSGRLEYQLFPNAYFLQARLGIVLDLN